MQPRIETAAVNLKKAARAGEFEFGLMGLNERALHSDCFAKRAAAFLEYRAPRSYARVQP